MRWTGCVPSKALLAAGKVAHHMRTADDFGIEPVEPTVDRGRVWKHIRAHGLKFGHNVAIYRAPAKDDIEIECGVQVAAPDV